MNHFQQQSVTRGYHLIEACSLDLQPPRTHCGEGGSLVVVLSGYVTHGETPKNWGVISMIFTHIHPMIWFVN